MVNLCRVLMGYGHGHPYKNKNMYRWQNVKTDGSWRKRQVLKLSSHFWGRGRNCFSIAIRRLQKSLQYVRIGRSLRQAYMKRLWEQRIDAGAQELGHMPQGSDTMLEGLARSNILLNRQVVSNLAIWEPRTFECLNKIAAVRAREEKIARQLGPFPRGILGKL